MRAAYGDAHCVSWLSSPSLSRVGSITLCGRLFRALFRALLAAARHCWRWLVWYTCACAAQCLFLMVTDVYQRTAMVAIGATLSAASRGHCRLDGWVLVFFCLHPTIFFSNVTKCVCTPRGGPRWRACYACGARCATWLLSLTLLWAGSIVPYGRLFRVPPAAAQHCWPFVRYLARARPVLQPYMTGV